MTFRGKNPTEKPELIKVLKERQQKEKKKELEEHLKAKRTSFDIRLEEQASKISQVRTDSTYLLHYVSKCCVFMQRFQKVAP